MAHELFTATVNRSAVVHYAYEANGSQFTLCNGERMGYRRIATRTNNAATCKRCIRSRNAESGLDLDTLGHHLADAFNL